MNIGRVLAVANIILVGGASIGYLIHGDLRHTIYWAAAAVLTATVTF
jgi:hypothetical protein